jgi:drug/metabolite transporter (DMT)-like permease
MNPSELHLAINHLPLFSTLFGTLILLGGLIFRKEILNLTAYLLIILGTLGALVSVYSGEEAEELVEDYFPEISHEIIHEHEEAAEGARNLSLALGVLSLIALFLNHTKRPLEKVFAWILVLGSLAGSLMFMRAAHSGGEIMHIEIRDNFDYEDD